MKKVTITAHNGIGKEKVLVGSKEVDMPESTIEAARLFTEEKALNMIISSYTIEVQRDIRAGTNESAKSKLNKLLAYAAANPDSDVAKSLVDLEIVKPKTSEAPTATQVVNAAPIEESKGKGKSKK
jgi:hypothetical protein